MWAFHFISQKVSEKSAKRRKLSNATKEKTKELIARSVSSNEAEAVKNKSNHLKDGLIIF